MKKVLRLLAFFFALTFSLCGCGAAFASTDGSSIPDTTSEQTIAWRSAFWFQDVPVASVTHGEDYTIQWVDKGLETHVRQLLEKP